MTIVKATLIRHATLDGMVEIWEDVPLGKTYEVILESRRTVTLYNIKHQVNHQKEIIDAISGRWLPLECLKLEETPS